MAPFAINSSGAGTNTIYTGYGAQSELSATKVTDVGFLRGFTDLETLRLDVSYDGLDLDDPDVMADIRALLDSGVHVRYEPQRR